VGRRHRHDAGARGNRSLTGDIDGLQRPSLEHSATDAETLSEGGTAQEAIQRRPESSSDLAPVSTFGFGSGAGIRTLNLAVNRSLQPVQKWLSLFAECR
jgi:hypothetical protein